MAIEGNEEKYPSVKLAYQLAIDSYEELRRSRDSIHKFLNSLLSIALSLLLAVPLVGKAFDLTPKSCDKACLYAVIGVFVFALAVCLCGLVGRLKYKVPMIDPRKLFKNKLHLSEWEFKKDMIYEAGQAFDSSSSSLENKWRWAIATTVCLILQIVALAFLVSGILSRS